VAEQDCRLECQDKYFIIGVPNTFVAEYLEKNQRSLIEKYYQYLREDVKWSSVLPPQPKRRLSTHQSASFQSTVYFRHFRVGNSTTSLMPPLQRWLKSGLAFNPLFLHGGAGWVKPIAPPIGNKPQLTT